MNLDARITAHLYLAGKVALLMSGIGRAIAVKLSERYSVVLGGRGVARLAETHAVQSRRADPVLAVRRRP